MKKYFTLINALIFFSLSSYTQDLITKKNGVDIKSKVVEVSMEEVKYKKFENLDGPIFTLLIKDIIIIRYENGSKDLFNGNKINLISKTLDTNRIKFIPKKKGFLSMLEVSSFFTNYVGENIRTYGNINEPGIFVYDRQATYQYTGFKYIGQPFFKIPISLKLINGYKFNERFALGIGLEYTKIENTYDYYTISSELFYYTIKDKNSPFVNLDFGLFKFANEGLYNNPSLLANYTIGGKLGYKYSINKSALQLSFGLKYNSYYNPFNERNNNIYLVPALSYLF